MSLPAISGGFIFTASGIRYAGKNYYEFPYDAEQRPSLKAVENILAVVQDLITEGTLKVRLEEVPNVFYTWNVYDADDANRITRHNIDAHFMITTFLTQGVKGLCNTLYPDNRYSF